MANRTYMAKRPAGNTVLFKEFPKVEARRLSNKKLGFGLFATQDIPKDSLLFFARGKHIHDIDNDEAPDYPDAIRIAPNTWIYPGAENPLTYTNHSCDPNAGIEGRRTFRALRNIKKDEQICFDYALSECDMLWEMEAECICGAAKCRKRISSIQTLPLDTYKSYLPYIPEWLQKEYLKFHRK